MQNKMVCRTYHLLELATMTPLSIEKASLGRPKMFQAWILIGSPRHLLNENSLEQGIFLVCNTAGMCFNLL